MCHGRGHHRIASVLLEHKANLTLVDAHGWTAAKLAEACGHDALSQLLHVTAASFSHERQAHARACSADAARPQPPKPATSADDDQDNKQSAALSARQSRKAFDSLPQARYPLSSKPLPAPASCQRRLFVSSFTEQMTYVRMPSSTSSHVRANSLLAASQAPSETPIVKIFLPALRGKPSKDVEAVARQKHRARLSSAGGQADDADQENTAPSCAPALGFRSMAGGSLVGMTGINLDCPPSLLRHADCSLQPFLAHERRKWVVATFVFSRTHPPGSLAVRPPSGVGDNRSRLGARAGAAGNDEDSKVTRKYGLNLGAKSILTAGRSLARAVTAREDRCRGNGALFLIGLQLVLTASRRGSLASQ